MSSYANSTLEVAPMKENKFEGFDKWEVEDALRCMTRAAEIKKNTKLHAAVKKMAAMKIREMESVKEGMAGSAKK